MNYLSVEEVTIRFGDRLIFENLSFGLDKGEKMALVARNGTGKTTLLNCLNGKLIPESGRIVFRNNLTISHLNQEDIFQDEDTVKSLMFSGDDECSVLLRRFQYATDNGQCEGDEWNQMMEDMNRLGVWEYENNVLLILDKLKVNFPEKKVIELSGGQVKRLMLAKALSGSPDVMFLDEPTNHLDLEMIEWLENYLTQITSSVFMVTHDRYFLENICDTILELDEGILYKYPGNYSEFLQRKDERRSMESSSKEKAMNLYRKELDWIRRQPKARGTKSKARVDAFTEVKKKAFVKISEDDMTFDINMTRLGAKILEFHNVTKLLNDQLLLKPFSYKMVSGEKVGLVGPNGCGKSTLLRMILELTNVSSGKIVQGDTVNFGYYSQEGISLKEDRRIIEYITDIAEVIPLKKGRKITASQFLELFLFPSKMQYQKISTLSGGEKRRLYLVSILMQNPNFLILDEPTNDLDVFTLTVLENFLMEFQGCLICVSHDRYFLNKVVDKVWVFTPNNELKELNGTYSTYKLWAKENMNEKKTKSKETELSKKEAVEKNKLSYNEKLEFEKLELSIEKLEMKKNELTKALESEIDDFEKISAISLELENVVHELEINSNRWLELSEYV